MTTINQYFSVKFLVSSYTDAQFNAFCVYEKILQTKIILLLAFATAMSMIYGIGATHFPIFSWGVGVGLFLIGYAIFQNSSPLKIIRRTIISHIWGIKIDQKIQKAKSDSRNGLCGMKFIIEEMKGSYPEWREIATDAEAIIEYRS